MALTIFFFSSVALPVQNTTTRTQVPIENTGL